MSDKTSWIVDTSDATFQQDVIQRSHELPIVVDFWAQWCQPCRSLGPILEELAEQLAGQFVLVKANTETCPIAAAEFRVQSIPAVYGLRDGRIVDGFLGAMPKSELQEWLTRFLPSPAERQLAEGLAQLAINPAAAERCIRESIQADPKLVAAQIALANLLLTQDRLDPCAEIVAALEKRGFLEPEAERLKAALERRRLGAAAGGLESCRAAATREPSNLQLQLQLADALAADQRYDEALNVCLQIVQRDRAAFRDRARQTMVDIFRLLPEDSPLAREFRRKLSLALF
jgi:putative thioredoxin